MYHGACVVLNAHSEAKPSLDPVLFLLYYLAQLGLHQVET